MIEYKKGTWKSVLQLEGSVFPRACARAIPAALFTCILHVLLRTETLKEHIPWMSVGAPIMSNFTFVLGFLIVFRVNHAYARWWEAGTLLQKIRGDWFNAYSSLLAFANEGVEKQREVEHFKHTLARLVSLLYSNAIHLVSQGEPGHKVFECIDIEGLSPVHIDFMQKAPNRCEVILQWIQKLIVEGNEKQLVKIAPPILSRVYNQLGDGIVDLNNARKIAEFPIPFPLEQMVTIMLFIHVFLTCTVCAFSIKTAFWAFLFAFIIVFSFHSINYIAGELEDPFGHDANDLPLVAMTQDMNTSLITLLAARAMTVPPNLNFGDTHRDLICKCIDFDKDLGPMAAGDLSHLDGRDARPPPPDHKTLAKAKDAKVNISKMNSFKETVETKLANTAVSSKVTEKRKQTARMNERDVESQIDMVSGSRGQGAAAGSASKQNTRNSSPPPSTTESVARKREENTRLLPEGALSADGGQVQATIRAVGHSAQSAAPALTSLSVGRGSGAPAAASISSSRPLVSSQPSVIFLSEAEVLSEVVEASRQTTQANAGNSVLEAKVEETHQAVASELASGKLEASADVLPASIETVDGEREQMATMVPPGNQGVTREIGPPQEMKPTAPRSAGGQSVHIQMPAVTQNDDHPCGQQQELLSAATGVAGKERMQTSMSIATTTHSVGKESGQTVALLAVDEGARREFEGLALGEYLSDWL